MYGGATAGWGATEGRRLGGTRARRARRTVRARRRLPQADCSEDRRVSFRSRTARSRVEWLVDVGTNPSGSRGKAWARHRLPLNHPTRTRFGKRDPALRPAPPGIDVWISSKNGCYRLEFAVSSVSGTVCGVSGYAGTTPPESVEIASVRGPRPARRCQIPTTTATTRTAPPTSTSQSQVAPELPFWDVPGPPPPVLSNRIWMVAFASATRIEPLAFTTMV